MMVDASKCPVCGKEAMVRCRCPRCDSRCESGHEWHVCLEHDRIVLGASDHSKDTFACSCLREVVA